MILSPGVVAFISVNVVAIAVGGVSVVLGVDLGEVVVGLIVVIVRSRIEISLRIMKDHHFKIIIGHNN